ncbi:MAG: L-threonylcarbamoyladenylate synthase [Candidatus Aminicenantia bacterium]
MGKILNGFNKESIEISLEVLKEGGLVIFPTETVYGLGANAFNPIAVSKIFELKRRPKFDPLIVHLGRIEEVEKIVEDFPPLAKKLGEEFWPGPLTIVLPKKEIIPDIVTAGLPTVGVRIPSHPVALELLKKSPFPISAPSANSFGYLSPTSVSQIEPHLRENVDLILDGGNCKVGVESTIVLFRENRFYLLRPGGVPVEEIERIVNKVENISSPSPLSPGMLNAHYAPKKRLIIFKNLDEIDTEKFKKIGVLFFKNQYFEKKSIKKVEFLSEKGDMREAATNLFSALHRLDDSDVDVIYAEEIAQEGLGRAIMDRLIRASSKGS